MHLALVGEPEAASGRERQGRRGQLLRKQARPPGRLPLLAQWLGIAVGGVEEIAVHPFESAVERRPCGTGGDDLDGGRVARGRQPRPFRAVEALEAVEAGVDGGGQVGGGPPRLARPDALAIEHHHRETLLGEPGRRREPRDAGADHADVGADVLVQRRDRGQVGARAPGSDGSA